MKLAFTRPESAERGPINRRYDGLEAKGFGAVSIQKNIRP